MSEEPDLFIIAVAAIIIKKDKLLMMKRSSHKKTGAGLWETLSGKVQHDEDPYNAVKREIQEESSLQVEVEKTPIDFYMIPRTNLAKPQVFLIVYKAKYLSGDVILSDEHSEYSWSTPQEFETKSTLKRLIQSVHLAFKG